MGNGVHRGVETAPTLSSPLIEAAAFGRNLTYNFCLSHHLQVQ